MLSQICLVVCLVSRGGSRTLYAQSAGVDPGGVYA